MQSPFALTWRCQSEWSWQVALDLFCGGLGAATFLLALWLGSPRGGWTGVGLVVLAAVVLLSHLGRRWRFLFAFRRLRHSWISRGALYMSLFVLLSALALTQGAGAAAWAAMTAAGQILSVLAGIAALLVMLYPGFVLASSPSIPFWNSPLVPVLFATFSFGSAALLLLLLGDVAAATVPQAVWGVALPLLVANLLLLFVYLEVMSRSVAAAREAVRWLLRGPLAVPFLGVVVGLGLVAPLLLLLIGMAAGAGAAGPGMLWVQLAAVVSLVGAYAFRHYLLRAGIYGPPL